MVSVCVNCVQVTCCNEGFKLLMDVIVCESPCCPGLREYVTDDAPHLGLVVACVRVRMTTQRHRQQNKKPSCR